MPQQLVLIEPDTESTRRPAGGLGVAGDDWRLDPETREIGLRGIAEARRILAESTRRTGERTAA